MDRELAIPILYLKKLAFVSLKIYHNFDKYCLNRFKIEIISVFDHNYKIYVLLQTIL